MAPFLLILGGKKDTNDDGEQDGNKGI